MEKVKNVLIKDKYSIGELAEIAKREQVEINITFREDETCVDIEPIHDRSYPYYLYYPNPVTPYIDYRYTSPTCVKPEDTVKKTEITC